MSSAVCRSLLYPDAVRAAPSRRSPSLHSPEPLTYVRALLLAAALAPSAFPRETLTRNLPAFTLLLNFTSARQKPR